MCDEGQLSNADVIQIVQHIAQNGKPQKLSSLSTVHVGYSTLCIILKARIVNCKILKFMDILVSQLSMTMDDFRGL